MKRALRLVAACFCVSGLFATVPEGWHFAGSKPQEYDCNVDLANPYNGLPSTLIRSKAGITTSGFGTLLQDFSPEKYKGKRIRLSAWVKSQDVTSWAGLWMRLDDANHPKNGYPGMVGFDNMQDRPVKGTTGWANYSVVLDVPEEATAVFIGILLAGPGSVWIAGTKVEVVGADVPVTSKALKPVADGPVNLDFSK